MSFLEQENNQIRQPLLHQIYDKSERVMPILQNKRKSRLVMIHEQMVESKNISVHGQGGRVFRQNKSVSQQVLKSMSDLIEDLHAGNNNLQSTVSQKKSIKVKFNKKRGQDKKASKDSNQKKDLPSNYLKRTQLNKTIYQKFQLQGLRIKPNWQMPTKSKQKSFNSQIMNLQQRVQWFLYYMNLILNTIFRISLLAILILMIIYQQEYKLMQMIIIMEVVAAFLYSLAMIKMLYTKKDDESIYLQKHFTDRDITDIEMDRVLRKHFTWRNILKNVSSYFRLNSKFKNDIKISILRQEIFKRMEIVLCFIPFTVIFFTTPTLFRFECDYPVQMIVTATICLQSVRMTVHYIVIFIQN